MSPAAAKTVLPSMAASRNAWLNAVRLWAAKPDSAWPQLMESRVTSGSWTAAVMASRKPRSVLGAKNTLSRAPGARAPATSMSSSTSPSAPLGSPVGAFRPPSTDTLATVGAGATPRAAK